MEILGIARVTILVVSTCLLFVFSRRLSHSLLKGYNLIAIGISLLMFQLILGSVFHSTFLSEELRNKLLPVFGFVSGYIGLTLGLAFLVVGVYRLVRSLQPHLNSYYASLVEHSLVGVYLIQDGLFKFANPRLAEITGYEREELIGKAVLDLVALEDHSLVRDSIRERISGQVDTKRYECRVMRKNGELIYTEVFGSRMTYQGRPAIHGMLLDVTDRKEAEEATKESEERYRVITENAYDLISEISPDGRFLYASPNHYEVLGYHPNELIGRRIFDLVHPDDKPAARKQLKKDIESVSSGQITIRFLHKNDTWHWFECAGKTFVTAKGEPRGVIVSRDITYRRLMEEELLQGKKLESLGRLAGGIAHDFNNLLTAILGNISLAKMDLQTDDQTVIMLNDAEDACMKARDLTHQLLTFSKGGAPVKKKTSINSLIKETVNFTLRGSNIRCKFDLASDLWDVEIDEGQVSQVISNLVINADESMQDGGQIRLCAHNLVIENDHYLPLKEGRHIKISIEDQGIGIPEKHLSKVFDPYFSTKHKGSGLGLAAAYSIIKNHDGLITVESKLGVGTTFHIYLPGAGEMANPSKITKGPGRSRNGKYRRLKGSNRRILVMDDEPAIRQIITRGLSRLGLQVELAENGSKAIELYKKATREGKPFDAVIMDLTIPGGLGGKETIKVLKDIDPNVRAIVSSGYSNDPIMAEYEKYGFMGVVSKPFQLDQLSKKLHEVLSKSNETVSS